MSEREVVSGDLNRAIDEFRAEGFRLDVIYPADEPTTALMSRDGEALRVTTRPGTPQPSGELPPFVPEFILTSASRRGGEGRAGMHYRDLIPSRLGGRYIASHITIADGGPVSDWVHYHRIAFQMIYVRRGWVRVVYEDQGAPFVMTAGDMVLQPPRMRHRVLESSPGLEVVEITAPALHETCADHDLLLPNRERNGRSFGTQTFLRHVASETPWTPFAGGEAQESAMDRASGGMANVRIIRPAASEQLCFVPHDGELVFGFVLAGSARLTLAGDQPLAPADAFVIPPAEAWTLCDASDDFRLLHVTTAKLA